MTKIFVCMTLLSVALQCQAVDYFVSGEGDDSHDGLSVETAFRNIQRAADLTEPGDVVTILNGTYTEPETAERVLSINRSGDPGNWIVYRSFPGHTPQVFFTGWAGVEIQGASYIEINGLTIIGNADAISVEYALGEMSNLVNPSTSGNAIFIRGNPSEGRISQHIRIIGNNISKAPGGGIGAMHADYLTIADNTVRECGFYSPYANSGISIYQALDVDDYPGYKIKITGNVASGNYNYVPFYFSNPDPSKRIFTDGNGIIIDDLRGSQSFVDSAPPTPYRGRTLIANNVCYHNGGSGIHTYESQNVDIIHNTAFHNGLHPEMETAQIFANSSEKITIANNILWAKPGKKINDEYKVTDVRYINNLFFDGTDSPNVLVPGENTVIQNPDFAELPPNEGAFRLSPDSPCVDRGIRLPVHDIQELSKDADSGSRIKGEQPDIGAFEFAAMDCEPVLKIDFTTEGGYLYCSFHELETGMVLENSTDLVSWSPVQIRPVNQAEPLLLIPDSHPVFYRLLKPAQ